MARSGYVVEAFGYNVIIPNGYKMNSEGFYQNGHGVEYGLVRYGEDCICLETVYSKHVRTVELKFAENA